MADISIFLKFLLAINRCHGVIQTDSFIGFTLILSLAVELYGRGCVRRVAAVV